MAFVILVAARPPDLYPSMRTDWPRAGYATNPQLFFKASTLQWLSAIDFLGGELLKSAADFSPNLAILLSSSSCSGDLLESTEPALVFASGARSLSIHSLNAESQSSYSFPCALAWSLNFRATSVTSSTRFTHILSASAFGAQLSLIFSPSLSLMRSEKRNQSNWICCFLN